MTASKCADCSRWIVGPVAAVLHYERTGPNRVSPCERHRRTAGNSGNSVPS